ncbi:MAG: T9SS type A sorting domain-containing protein [Bacteroidia bacterium]|nr:T9SS type A sorting domain-containing protein [Bacteroidia bacterium]
MKKLLFTFYLLIGVSFAQSAIGFRNVSFTAAFNNQTISARVFYPATSAGQNTPIVSGSFPVIAFGHGFNMNYLDYQQICGYLASYGYYVITPNVQNGFNVNHQDYAKQLAACILYLQAENNISTSVFYQKVTSKSGSMGHSMGGGSSYLVPSNFSSIDAVCGLAPANTNPSAITALASNTKPVSIISSELDNVVPEADHAAPFYQSTNGPKHWIKIKGGGHCEFSDNPTICDLVSGAATIPRSKQIALAQRYSRAFFDYFLKNDPTALPWICGDSVLNDTSVVLTTNINNCVTVSNDWNTSPNGDIFPNPFSDKIIIRGNKDGKITILNLFGQTVWTQSVSANTWIQLPESLTEGIYWVQWESDQQKIIKKLLKRN